MADSNIQDLPMVKEPTRAQSENIQTVLDRLRGGRVVIPDYQRDAEQWDERKESIFIESILNNLTIPAFFFAENDDGTIEVVDGQQRLNTLYKFSQDKLKISEDEDVVYLTPQSILYKGKMYTEIEQKLKNIFNDYPLTVIYLPRNLELGIKLEIFRRINEGGTPLTSQDIRLSYYSDSKSVTFIRLAGLYSDSEASKKMILSASKKGVKNPWLGSAKAKQIWHDWWDDKVKAKGQTPSEMFLWFLISLHRHKLHTLLSTPTQMKHLPISFRGTTEEALDIYCAQLQYTDAKGGPTIFPTWDDGLDKLFKSYLKWVEFILTYGASGISVDKYKQMALIIAAGVELKVDPKRISNDAWDAIADFIRTPRSAGAKWLKSQGGYPEQKGRWAGEKGQKGQCDKVVKLLEAILKKHP